MKNIVTKIWRGEAKYWKWFLLLPLYFLSKVYDLCLIIRSSLYKSGMLKIDEVPIPVLAIGNITVGGTGKTPLVERLAFRLKEIGFNPGIITRGYKRSRQGTFCVDIHNDKAIDVGDEALMLAKKMIKIPVFVSKRRAPAIIEAMKKHSIDLAILDDGYQVKNIMKNVDVVVIKGGQYCKSTDLFPLGPCREPINRLKNADAILINNGSIEPEIASVIESIPTFHMAYRPMHLYNMKHNLIIHYNVLKGKKVLAFSGLGDNNSFFELLRSLGTDVVREFSFQDHYTYRNKDIEELSSYTDVNMIVTTEKDAVKIFGMTIPDNLFYLSIEANIEKEQELIEVILNKIEVSGLAIPDLGADIRTHKHWVH
jgi:tetraacyldisaccharide 4'-kinase